LDHPEGCAVLFGLSFHEENYPVKQALNAFALGIWPKRHKYAGRQNQKDFSKNGNLDLPRNRTRDIRAPPGPTPFLVTFPRMQPILGIDSHQLFKILETQAMNHLNLECEIIGPN
jgi:hypothetical protein